MDRRHGPAGPGAGDLTIRTAWIEDVVAREHYEKLLVLTELIGAGKITPVIDRTYPLSEVPQAIRYLEEGQAHGKIVITV